MEEKRAEAEGRVPSEKSLSLNSEEGEAKFARMMDSQQNSARLSVGKNFKRNKLNFEIYDDIFDMEQSRINRNFHENEHDHYWRSQQQPCLQELEQIEQRVRDQYEKARGDTAKDNPFQRDENIKKLREAAGGFKGKKPSLTQEEMMEDLARCKANRALLAPQHKNIRFEKFCKDPVAFYLYKRKNLFLEDRLAQKKEEQVNRKRRHLLQLLAQRQEKAKKDAERQAALQQSQRSQQLNPLARAHRSGGSMHQQAFHSASKSQQVHSTIPAPKAYETAPPQTALPGIRGAQSPPRTP